MTRLNVRVQPKAPRAGLKGWRADGALALRVTVAPEQGRANRAVLKLLAEVLGIAVNAVTLEGGAAARSKWIEIDGLSEREVRRRIDAALAAARGASHGG